MALSKIVKINDKLSWALWKIDEQWQQLLYEKNFSKDTFDALDAISHPIKKAEFLSSRLALHALLTTSGLLDYELVKDEYGKPYIKNADYHISLANSYPYAVAVIDKLKPTGIDIERPSEKLVRVQHKFLHPLEIPFFGGCVEKLCLAWCAKECLYKLHGRKDLSFKQHIRINEILYPHQPTLKAGIILEEASRSFQLQIERIENFFILFSV